MKCKVKVKNDTGFCGVGAGGVQFAYGECVIENDRLINWFKEHDGYEVEVIEGAEKKSKKKDETAPDVAG